MKICRKYLQFNRSDNDDNRIQFFLNPHIWPYGIMVKNYYISQFCIIGNFHLKQMMSKIFHVKKSLFSDLKNRTYQNMILSFVVSNVRDCIRAILNLYCSEKWRHSDSALIRNVHSGSDVECSPSSARINSSHSTITIQSSYRLSNI